MKWWRWAVVSVVHLGVCNMAPSPPGEPPPPGFEVELRPSVRVLSRHRSVRAAKASAPAARDALEDAGHVLAAVGVEVWSRDRVERECPKWEATVRQ